MCVAVAVIVGLVVPQLVARRRRADRLARLVATARVAAERLGVQAPIATSRGVCLGGTIDGCEADLEATEYWASMRVRVEVPGLPAGLTLQPWPTGRATEDIVLANMRKTGHAAFDAHFGVAGSAAPVGAIDPRVLDVVAELHDARAYIFLTHDHLGVHSVRPSVPRPPGTPAGRELDVDDFVDHWTATREVLERIASRGVLRAPTRR